MNGMALAHPGHASATVASVAVVVASALAAGYLVAVATARPRWSAWRTASWLAGCVLVAGAPAFGGPGDARSHILQHLLLGMFAPLGLVLAAPVTLLLRVCTPPGRRATVRVLSTWPVRVIVHPVSALLLSVGGLWIVMLTTVYVRGGALLHLHYLAAGCLLTWSIAGPDPSPHRARRPTRVMVLLAAAAGHAILAKYLYAEADRVAGSLLTDARELRRAAVLMYYGGDLAELLLALALFAAWYARRGRRLAGGPSGDHPPPAIDAGRARRPGSRLGGHWQSPLRGSGPRPVGRGVASVVASVREGGSRCSCR